MVGLVRDLDETVAAVSNELLTKRVNRKLADLRSKGLVHSERCGRVARWSVLQQPIAKPQFPLREIPDEVWLEISAHLPPPALCHKQAVNTRRFVTVMANIAAHNLAWDDIPDDFGYAQSLRQRFKAWAKVGAWHQLAPPLGAAFGSSTVAWLTGMQEPKDGPLPV